MIRKRSMRVKDGVAGGSAEANEQRDKRAARSLCPADEGCGFERSGRGLSESVACTGVTATASGLVRRAVGVEFCSARRAMLASCFREEETERRVRAPASTLFISEIASRVQLPNKTPEPTLGLARSSQGSVVFDLVAGVAHL